MKTLLTAVLLSALVFGCKRAAPREDSDTTSTSGTTTSPPAGGGLQPKTAFTPDEITLLKLVSRRYCYVGTHPNRVEITRPILSDQETVDLMGKLYDAGGRDRQLASRYLLWYHVSKAFQAVDKSNAQLTSNFPTRMREIVLKDAALFLREGDVPPMFSEEFNDRARATNFGGWVSKLQKSEGLKAELIVKMEQIYVGLTTSVEKDLTPALGRQALAADTVQVRQRSGGQLLNLKYVGTDTLTNVILLSRVTQGREGELAGRGSVDRIDAFNRAFAAPKEYTDDAKRLLVAKDIHGSMPKYSTLFLPRIAPGDDISFHVGFMHRGALAKGNTSTLALYCDQGRIEQRGTSEFPELPLEAIRPKSPETKPKKKSPGEKLSSPAPKGAADRLYAGSVWRGSSAEHAINGIETKASWEIILTSRNGKSFRADAYRLDKERPRAVTVTGWIGVNGSVTLNGSRGFLTKLQTGKLDGDRLTFAPPALRRGSKMAYSTIDLTYVAPEDGK